MLSSIVAMGKNNEIGLKGKMPWHLPNDLRYFKNTTIGSIIVMGRKTFEGLPKILEGRKHVILTKDRNFSIEDENVEIVHSIDEILSRYKDLSEEVFITGGASVYEIFLPYCEKLYITHIFEEFQCDTFFPEIDYSKYKTEFESENQIDENTGIEYKFLIYSRN